MLSKSLDPGGMRQSLFLLSPLSSTQSPNAPSLGENCACVHETGQLWRPRSFRTQLSAAVHVSERSQWIPLWSASGKLLVFPASTPDGLGRPVFSLLSRQLSSSVSFHSWQQAICELASSVILRSEAKWPIFNLSIQFSKQSLVWVSSVWRGIESIEVTQASMLFVAAISAFAPPVTVTPLASALSSYWPWCAGHHVACTGGRFCQSQCMKWWLVTGGHMRPGWWVLAHGGDLLSFNMNWVISFPF